MSRKNDRTGEKRMMNCGLEAEIIEYISAQNMTIRFSNQHIKRNVHYSDFKNGQVWDRPTFKEKRISRIHETKQMKTGELVTIVEYKNSSHICVKFPNEKYVWTTYHKFKNGDVTDGTVHLDDNFQLNQKKISTKGYLYEIIRFLPDEKGLVRFENNEEKVYSLRAIKRNNIVPTIDYHKKKNDSICKKRDGKYHVGDILTNKYGLTAEIIAIYKPKKYDFCFTDGTILNISMSNFQNRKTISLSQKLKDNVSLLIGETALSKNGVIGTIIGGTSHSNLTIQFEDGTIKTGCKYYKFKNGAYSNLQNHQIRTDKQKKERLGETKLSRSGMIGEIVDYTDYEHILIQLESGETIHTNYLAFSRGQFGPVSPTIFPNTSMNEYTICFGLREYGFQKAPMGSLKQYGLGQKELDIFHPKYKIAIEYDGARHQFNKEKDLEKDKLCKAAGITLIRIRESCDKLNSGISLEICLNDSHHFSNALQACFDKLCGLVSSLTGENVTPISLIDKKDQILEEYSKILEYQKKVGQVNYNKDGFKMTIIRYNGSRDMDVAFENGYIAYHRSSHDFFTGKIHCKQNHFGEESISRLGEKIKIVSNCYGNIVDVEFPNGYIAKNQYYSDFLLGHITNKPRKGIFQNSL